MRIFTAIPLPQDVKDSFSRLAAGRLPVPYVNTGNFHITLNFFGELDTDAVARLRKFWEQDFPPFKKFPVAFDRLVKFRNQIHMTLKPNPALNQLQQTLTDHFMKSGFGLPERQYYPHVKVANLHMDNVMNRERKLENFPHRELAALDFIADRVVMYESKLLLHHAHHTALAEKILD